MKKLIIVLACLVCIVFLAGCAESPAAVSGSQSAQTHLVKVVDAAGNAIEPEQLISKEEAAQVLGQDVQDGEKSEKPEAGQKLVLYKGANLFSSDFLEITISQQVPEGMFQTGDETAGAAAGDAQQNVFGAGTRYIFHSPGLHILSDGYYLVFAGGDFTDKIVHERLNQAGVLAAANLKKLLGN